MKKESKVPASLALEKLVRPRPRSEGVTHDGDRILPLSRHRHAVAPRSWAAPPDEPGRARRAGPAPRRDARGGATGGTRDRRRRGRDVDARAHRLRPRDAVSG